MSCHSVSPVEVLAEIEEKHWSLMKEGIDYGSRRGDLFWDVTNKDISYGEHYAYVEYAGGRICWGFDTGAHGVHGSFMQGWRSRLLDLGYPVTTSRSTKTGLGMFSHFQGGSLVTSSGSNWTHVYKNPRRVYTGLYEGLLVYDSQDKGLPIPAERHYPWMLVILPNEVFEEMMLRERQERVRTTDYRSCYVALLLGYFPHSGYSTVEPIHFSSRSSSLLARVQVNLPDKGLYHTMITHFPYWELEIPNSFSGGWQGQFPPELRIKYVQQPSSSGEIVTY